MSFCDLPEVENTAFRHGASVFSPCGGQAFSLAVSVKDGVVYESQEEWGWAHFLEHMNLQKTDEHKSLLDITMSLEAAGGKIAAFTRRDDAVFSITAPSWALIEAFKIMRAVFSFYDFEETDVDAERNIIFQEFDREKSQVASYYVLASEGELLSPSKASRYGLGNPESLHRASAAALADYKRKVYNKKNTFLSLVGNFDYDRAIDLASDFFSVLPDGEPRKNSDFAKLPEYKKVIFFETPGTARQIQTVIGFRLDEKAERMKAMLFNTLVGVGFSSLFYRKLRVENKLTYSTAAILKAYPGMGTFRLVFAVDPENFSKAKALAFETLEDVAELRISERDFELAKRRLWGSVVMKLSALEEYGYFINRNLLVTGRERLLTDFRSELSAISIEELADFASSYMTEKNSVISLIASSESIHKAGFG